MWHRVSIDFAFAWWVVYKNRPSSNAPRACLLPSQQLSFLIGPTPQVSYAAVPLVPRSTPAARPSRRTAATGGDTDAGDGHDGDGNDGGDGHGVGSAAGAAAVHGAQEI